MLAAIFALIFQSELLASLETSSFTTLLKAIFIETSITSDNEILNELFNAKGVMGMLWTILLIICAMIFGGVMDGIGALARITQELLKLAKSVFWLVFQYSI